MQQLRNSSNSRSNASPRITALNTFDSDPSFRGQNAAILHGMQRKIQKMLGGFSGEEFVDNANWGPGVSTLLKGAHVSDVNKFQSDFGITRDLYSFVSPWFSLAYPLWADHLESEIGPQLFILQEGNEVVTVPKNSKTDRVIAIEPGINLWFQKSIGTMIRRRLSREGIDLNSQLRNQQLAHLSSKTDELATVDFSSASDSISKDLVREILPADWFSLCNATRSKIGCLDGRKFEWNKFSSMGNGFTFELESLIFYAAAFCVCEHLGISTENISVFGDDVIIPSDAYQLFSSFCEFLGFTVNNQKSFSSGYFRESCGSHYYDGLCCKPLYLKERLHNVQTIYKLANGIRRLAHRECHYRDCARRWMVVFDRLVRRVPSCLRLFIPEGIGDGGFIGNFDEATPSLAERGYEGYLVSALVESGRRSPVVETVGLLLARLWNRSIDQAHGNTYVLRGRTRIRITRILVPQWYSLGRWS
nr:MAG: RNA replicase beta chain [Sanya fiers-like virus 18]